MQNYIFGTLFIVVGSLGFTGIWYTRPMKIDAMDVVFMLIMGIISAWCILMGIGGWVMGIQLSKRMGRAKRDECLNCGYYLHKCESHACPECGSSREVMNRQTIHDFREFNRTT